MTILILNRQVSIEEGDSKSREFGIMFIETSAKAGFNIKVKINKFSKWQCIFGLSESILLNSHACDL